MRGDISIAVVAPTQPEDFFDLVWQGVWEATFDLASFGVQVAATLEEAGVSAPCVGFGNTDAVQPFLERKTVSAVLDGHRYLQGYFAVQIAYQVVLRRDKGDAPEDIRISSDVVFAANAGGKEDSIHAAFELLIR